MHAGSYLLALGIGLAFSVIFFLSFRGIILALDLKTPGREDHGANRAADKQSAKSMEDKGNSFDDDSANAQANLDHLA